MAGLALGSLVLAEQGELGVLIVVEARRHIPAGFAVALFATVAKATVMLVVLTVTSHALGIELGLDDGRSVTALAFDLLMLAAQRVFGVAIVVEGLLSPALGIMAILALGGEDAFVLVVLLVAAIAIARRVAVFDVGAVAIGTFDVDMLALKPEARLVMVELLRVLPFLLVMAIATGNA